MGTDIHLRLQRRTASGWEYLPVVEPNWRHPDHDVGSSVPDPTECCYNVFAFLANVRNGSGFAGVKTGEPIKPQFEARGFPADYDNAPGDPWVDAPESSPTRSTLRAWMGDHSFTWASVAELKAAPWDTGFDSCGVIKEKAYKSRIAAGITGAPESWCGDVWGHGLVTIESSDYAATRHTVHASVPESKCHVRVYWRWQPLTETGFKRWLDTLTEESLGVDLSDARVLMGFDS